ncbi:protein GLUTAMINE DUMPER 3 [Canna indica]|uniref:Protein GLUTAMINE DUMPER 3 n=1 Tax=Canna indica TaxID=4628 RepID=A0AAQ3KEE2_9LILI|nr:protein GLUTAMINE DUMPER 3 [Canna indica]
MRTGAGLSTSSTAAAATAASAPSSATSGAAHSAWHSPVPYLFGGLAAMMGLIAFALLILACSYWKLSGYLDSASDADGTSEDAASNNSDDAAKPPPPARFFEESIVVIMAGECKPTFLATPTAGCAAASFGGRPDEAGHVAEMEAGKKTESAVSSPGVVAAIVAAAEASEARYHPKVWNSKRPARAADYGTTWEVATATMAAAGTWRSGGGPRVEICSILVEAGGGRDEAALIPRKPEEAETKRALIPRKPEEAETKLQCNRKLRCRGSRVPPLSLSLRSPCRSAAFPPPTTSPYFNINVTARRPNKKIIYLYDPNFVSIASCGVDVADGSFAAFVQDAAFIQ